MAPFPGIPFCIAAIRRFTEPVDRYAGTRVGDPRFAAGALQGFFYRFRGIPHFLGEFTRV